MISEGIKKHRLIRLPVPDDFSPVVVGARTFATVDTTYPCSVNFPLDVIRFVFTDDRSVPFVLRTIHPTFST